ncbi:MAG: alpha/beta fold hydrolase [Alphaproteobacteria bacterium]|nr:alpha/beta fold hydrolase [Alphaproteobacteria bacterium]
MKPDWTVTTEDSITLGAKVTPPVGEPVGDVVLLHAMMVDARSVDRPPGAGLASTLAKAGFRVHRADFRGRGMSRGPRDWTYDDLVYRDVPALVGHVTAAHGTPWVVGHSLGGHVTAASWATGSCDIAGLVGIAANVWMPSLELSKRLRAKKAAGMVLLRASLRLFDGIAAKRAGMGPIDEAPGYGRDLAGFWKKDFWGDRTGRDWSAAMRTLEGPMLSVISRGDTLLAHPAGARAWAEQAPGCEVWEIRDGDHGMAAAPGHMELAVDGGSVRLWEAIGRWMRDRSSKSTS